MLPGVAHEPLIPMAKAVERSSWEADMQPVEPLPETAITFTSRGGLDPPSTQQIPVLRGAGTI